MSRQQKSLMNANINVVFYFATAIIAFFSRKIFLQYLGDDFIGLTGTVGNMLGLMNMAELGIGSAVGISLYKPIFENNRGEINEIISIFGYLWRKVGLIILGIAILISFFFPYFFSHTQLPLLLIYVLFFSFLASSLVGYFNNYQQILISSDQRNYIITLLFSSFMLVKTILQMVLVVYYRSFYGWIFIELLFNILYSLALNYKIKKDYPWLKSNVKAGETLFPKYRNLWVKTKEIFAHKVSYLVLNQTDTILIYSFTNLATVALYGNYMLIAGKLGALFEVLFTGLNAGIGNLIQEKDTLKVKKIFWEMNSFRYFMAGCLVIVLYFTMAPLISLWVGHKYIMDKSVLILILVNLYFMQIISAVELFKNSYGLFQDVWAPIIEVIINMTIAMVLGYFIGIQGVLLGTAISALLLKVIWKPYYLYKRGFHESVLGFWRVIAKYMAGFGLCILALHFLVPHFELSNIEQLKGFLIYSVLVTFTSLTIYGLFLYAVDEGFRNFMLRMWKLLPINKLN